MHQIITERLVLEPQLAAHASELFAVLADPLIYQFEVGPPVSLEWLTARLQRLESRQSPDLNETWLNWVVRLSSGTLCGYVQATVRGKQAQIAYMFNSQYWGLGMAREACAGMICDLKTHHQVSMLEAIAHRGNQRSRALLGRLGFHAAPATAPMAPCEIRMQREC